MAQYPFSQFTVEPVNAVPTGVYELARFRQRNLTTTSMDLLSAI